MSALISLLLPTRGRAQLAERFLRSALDCACSPQDVEIVIYADDDDPASHRITCPGLRVRRLVGPRISMGQCNSACLAASSGEIVILTNDDIVVRTNGWDNVIRDTHTSIEDQIYLAYPNDLLKGRKLCTFPILSRKTCTLIGEPFPSMYHGAFIDYHLMDVFKRLERAGQRRLLYLQDVVFEHMHYRTGKSRFDQTYSERNRFADDNVFLGLRDLRSEAAAKLLATVLREPAPAARPSRSAADNESHLTRATLGDRELPLQWSLRLAIWFAARTFARWILRPTRVDGA